MVECSSQLATDEELLGHIAQPAKSHRDHVANDGSPHLLPRFFSKFLTMLKTLKSLPLLHVSKVAVPLELSDQCGPLGPKGETRIHLERRDNFKNRRRPAEPGL
jgi:hypothetical protein